MDKEFDDFKEIVLWMGNTNDMSAESKIKLSLEVYKTLRGDEECILTNIKRKQD